MRLIDADELLLKRKIMNFDGYDSLYYVDVSDVIHAPTVKTENGKYGEWINDSGYDDWYCSECGFEINYDGEYPSEYSDFRYCGCCGARMNGEK